MCILKSLLKIYFFFFFQINDLYEIQCQYSIPRLFLEIILGSPRGPSPHFGNLCSKLVRSTGVLAKVRRVGWKVSSSAELVSPP